MANSVNEATITIRGTSFQLRTDMHPDELKRLAAHVDDKMRELDPKGSLPPSKVSVLTSLSFASDLIEEREKSAVERAQLAERLEKLETMLDRVLDGGR